MLGIIQDCAKDWRVESAAMGNIYRCSAITVAATGFSNGATGLYITKSPPGNDTVHMKLSNPQKVIDPDGNVRGIVQEGTYMLIDMATWQRGVDEAPLNNRGWVVQERALSTRTLHIGAEQMFWECLEMMASETFPAGLLDGSCSRQPKALIDPGKPKDWSEFDYNSDCEMNSQCSVCEYHPDYNSDEPIQGQTFPLTEPGFGQQNTVKDGFDIQNSVLSDLTSWITTGEELFHPSLYSHIYAASRNSILASLNLDYKAIRRVRVFRQWQKKISKISIQDSIANRSIYPLLHCKGMTHRQEQWLEIVQAYSGCSLTFDTDKLVAISGIARMMKDDMNCRYFSGLWLRDLEHQLLWKVSNLQQTPRTRVPSWSWTSVDAFVEQASWALDTRR
jgi:hypothetical protein